MENPEIEAIRGALKATPRPAGLVERRARLDALGARYTLPADVRTEQVDANGVLRNGPSTRSADADRVIMFLHGGAYISGSIASHRHVMAELGRQAEARTLALGYRLAPEHAFPAALDDALAGYRFLLSSGYDPARITLAGESAGGGLAIATLLVAARCRRDVAGIRLVQFAVGRSRDDRGDHDEQGGGRSVDSESRT